MLGGSVYLGLQSFIYKHNRQIVIKTATEMRILGLRKMSNPPTVNDKKNEETIRYRQGNSIKEKSGILSQRGMEKGNVMNNAIKVMPTAKNINLDALGCDLK